MASDMKRRLKILVLGATLLVAAPVGQAVAKGLDFNGLKVIDVGFPEEFARRMKEIGYKAKLEYEDDGTPIISERVSRLNYFIRFYNCEDKADCKHAIFSCGYDVEGRISLEFANRWNAKEPLGTFRIDDEGDPWIYHTINLVGGMTFKNLEDTLDWWADTLDTFKRRVDNKEEGETELPPAPPGAVYEDL